MDPLSFTASLATVGGLAAAGSKKMYELQRKIENAPKEVEHLLEQIQIFQGLVTALNVQLQEHQNNAAMQHDLVQVWGRLVTQMESDLQHLQSILAKVEPLVKTKSKRSKVLLLARQRIDKEEVERYRKMFDTHCSTLINIQAMVSGKQLDRLSQNTAQLWDESKVGFGFSSISSQLDNTEASNAARDTSILLSLGDVARNCESSIEKIDHDLQQQDRAIDLNEVGHEAILSSIITASSSNLEAHKTTRDIVRQYRGETEQLFRSHITFGKVLKRPTSRFTCNQGSNFVTMGTSVLWHWGSSRLPLGTLEITFYQSRQTTCSRHFSSGISTPSGFTAKFLPPQWFSNLAIAYSIRVSYEMTSSQWRWDTTLRPMTVNYDPSFINAVRRLDVAGVDAAFTSGRANPKDYIIKDWRNPGPWYESLGRSGSRHRGSWLRDAGSMFDYMSSNGLAGLDTFICRIYHKRRPSCVDTKNLVQSCVRRYLPNGGEITENLLFGVFLTAPYYFYCDSIEWIKDWALSSAEPWLLDEVDRSWSLVVCLFGVVAHCDATFREQLKWELIEYRAPASTKQPSAMDNIFEATFGAVSLKTHFHALQPLERNSFLSFLARAGTPSMLSLFIDLGADINVEEVVMSPLGAAIIAGNMRMIRTLLDAGANGALALSGFVRRAEDKDYLSDAEFKGRLELLLKNANPSPSIFFESHDPLSILIQSKRVTSCYPEAPKMLLAQNVVDRECLGENPGRQRYLCSYMYQAIVHGLPHVVDALLEYGLQANSLIADPFQCSHHPRGKQCDNRCPKMLSWLTLAVEQGDAPCVDVLIRHGADMIAPDGTGISALQRANSNVSGRHNRDLAHFDSRVDRVTKRFVTVEEDVQTLAVLEKAFNLRFQGRENIKDYTLPRDKSAPSSSPGDNKTPSFPRKLLNRFLRLVMSPEQSRRLQARLSYYKYDIKRLWVMPFHQALLVRFVYILSYAIIIVMEASAFINWNRRIQIPSRKFLFTVASLMLAVAWGSSWMSDS